ncbi:MAG: cysteine-rich CWC family protein [Halioglobus sp.]|nr:cysteine-rich CWC family protein [Halioglobus sp.]MCB1709785.1 cysteine-rich CWC family protein [Halioglobus sp.]MCP5122352.1 cysteine-rich CWC family protein [Pseudomonadales bacterium]MCP5191520.1 cysteine-rich CWC family protein [Pseudomonadales bacterium]
MTAPEQWLKTCPRCGGNNACALAAGLPAETCWCATATISSAALAALPADALGRRCLCPACGHSKGAPLDER